MKPHWNGWPHEPHGPKKVMGPRFGELVFFAVVAVLLTIFLVDLAWEAIKLLKQLLQSAPTP